MKKILFMVMTLMIWGVTQVSAQEPSDKRDERAVSKPQQEQQLRESGRRADMRGQMAQGERPRPHTEMRGERGRRPHNPCYRTPKGERCPMKCNPQLMCKPIHPKEFAPGDKKVKYKFKYKVSGRKPVICTQKSPEKGRRE